jgi:Cu2+-exporting ATPase
MIGDGVNDAPVLAQADVSIALAEGADLAQARAEVIVLSSRLDAVQGLFEVARRARRLMHQNLAWALFYNVVAVPLAALGHLAPALAVAGMAASSTLVVANALRAGRGVLPATAANVAAAQMPPVTLANAECASAREPDRADPWNRFTC